MGAKFVRNITKVLKSATGVLFGRVTSGTGRGEELTPSQVRSLLSVYTVTQTDTAISTAVNNLIGGSPGLLDTLDELASALGDDANFASTVTTALAGKVNTSDLSESIDDRVAALLVAGTNISLTYNDASGTLTVDSTAGGLSGTGSVDNAALRADGTGGAALQSSSWIIADNATASPNNTVNNASLQATGGTTNVSVSIVPKGTGAFCLAVPDGTTTGGNARAANAIDLQTARTDATQVASGTGSVLVGLNAKASNTYSLAVGFNATATGIYAIAIGVASATGSGSVCIGNENATCSGNGATSVGAAGPSASGDCSIALGGTATTSRNNELVFGFRHTLFDARPGGFLLSCKTTDATPTALRFNNIFNNVNFTTRSGTVLHGTLNVTGVKSDGSAVAIYTRRVVLKNVGGTITLVQSQTIGTDYEDNASTDLTVSNTSPFFQVTGIAAETWRWAGWFNPTFEIAYGT